MTPPKTLVVILGPTAVGKTSFAIQLAQSYQTEIISADSRQFFKELEIGVARPSAAELAAVKHHFVGFIPITQHYSAGMFESDALALLEKLFDEKDVVICVGGSMLYLQALIEGLDDMPSDTELKNRLHQQYQAQGIDHLQHLLQELDPEYYAEVDTMNPHRLIRGIEVCTLTGEKFSTLRSRNFRPRSFQTLKIGLTAQRNHLYKRINERVDQMMAQGLLEETRTLFPLRHLNALNTVGYKELFDHLEGHCTKEVAVDKIKQHTRNFAKRQLTWWRGDENIHWQDITQHGPSVAMVQSLLSDLQNWK